MKDIPRYCPFFLLRLNSKHCFVWMAQTRIEPLIIPLLQYHTVASYIWTLQQYSWKTFSLRMPVMWSVVVFMVKVTLGSQTVSEMIRDDISLLLSRQITDGHIWPWHNIITTFIGFHSSLLRSHGIWLVLGLQAEVTGGGVRLEDLDCATLESRSCQGLFMCGELLDVFGRIGGFNFYWAWLSGRVAGMAASQSTWTTCSRTTWTIENVTMV